MSDLNIKPLSGFRDFTPTEQAQRQWLIGLALEVYARYGYFPLETPALEREEILRGQYGEEGDKLRYRFEDQGKRPVGLRYDLTIPFARFVARFLPTGDIQLPFRRSQVAPVWRADSPQAGRYREFYQCDCDLAGSSAAEADAEIVLVAYRLLESLGVDFTLKISHRGVLDGILRAAGLPVEKNVSVLGILDKLEKIGREKVVELLEEHVGLSPEQSEAVLGLTEQSGEELERQLDEEGKAALSNLKAIYQLAEAGAERRERIKIDLRIVRGLSYYTGLVFETAVAGAEQFGSVVGGGRYDRMIGVFLNREIPAVGFSLGVDRCLALLAELGRLPTDAAKADLAVLAFPECQTQGFKLAERLRQAGLKTVLYPGGGKIAGMLSFAADTARYALIIGSDEVAEEKYQLKNLETHQQEKLSEAEIIQRTRM